VEQKNKLREVITLSTAEQNKTFGELLFLVAKKFQIQKNIIVTDDSKQVVQPRYYRKAVEQVVKDFGTTFIIHLRDDYLKQSKGRSVPVEELVKFVGTRVGYF